MITYWHNQINIYLMSNIDKFKIIRDQKNYLQFFTYHYLLFSTLMIILTLNK